VLYENLNDKGLRKNKSMILSKLLITIF